MRIMVTGGAGYIGAILSAHLSLQGHDVRVVDDLSTGHNSLVSESVLLIDSDIASPMWTLQLAGWTPECVIHLAASALVAEGEANPDLYVRNNVLSLQRFCELLSAMDSPDLRLFIFASTCSIYGDSGELARESDSPNPMNVYAATKLQGEQLLREIFRGSRVKTVCLRFFNVAGADAALGIGELHQPETHLIPLALESAALGTTMPIYGTDYPTEDGTAVRDFVHVLDVVSAIELLLGAGHLPSFEVLNIGSSVPLSVIQVVNAIQEVTGRKILISTQPRRPGDPPQLHASNELLRSRYGWRPLHSDVHSIVNSAVAWRNTTIFKELSSSENSSCP